MTEKKDKMAKRQPKAPSEPVGQQAGFDAYGISGIARYGPISRIYEEFLKELQGPQGMKSYREIMDNNAIVGAILFAANHLCRKVSWHFKPADESNRAREVADFVGSAIFDDMESTWPDTLSEILTMLPFGWALMEFRMKRRLGMGEISLSQPEIVTTAGGNGAPEPKFVPSRFKDGLIGFRSWELRSQETLFMWEFDTDSHAIVMQQMAPPDYRIRRIPLSKGLLFRTQVAKGSPEGRSVLRNAWVSYYMAKNLQIFEGIGIERDLAGYPMIQIAPPDLAKNQMPPDIWNTKDPAMVALLAVLKRIVTNVKRDEFEGMVMPWWAEFKLVTTGSRRNFDTNGIIGRYEQRIAMSVMADFIMLGHEAVGSKALAATKISLFTSSLSSFLDAVCAVIDRRAVTTLLQFNGIPQELAPTMQHGDVESVNLMELGDFISKMTTTGFNPLANPEAQKAAMMAAKLPTAGIGPDTAMDPKTVPQTAANSANGGAAGAGDKGKVGDDRDGEDDTSGNPVASPESETGAPAQLTTT